MVNPSNLPLTSFDTEQSLAVVWAALDAYREDLIPEGDLVYDAAWDHVCTAMAWITEALGDLEEIGEKP